MTKLFKYSKYNYTNINNQLVRDDRLSWKARGIFSYLWSQSDDWNFYVDEIAKHSPDGKTSLQTGLKELEKFGYLKRKPKQDNQNKLAGFDWILSDFPSNGKPVQRETRPTGNQPLRTNNLKNYQQQELTTNKKHSAAKPAQRALENEFEQLWKIYPNKKGKNQAFNHFKAWRKRSVKNTNDYLEQKLADYLKYCEINKSWYHPMNGSTWFNGRFDDDLEISDSKANTPTGREWFE